MKSPVIVVIARNGLMNIERIQTDELTNWLLPQRGLRDVLKYTPFRTRMTNFLKRSVTLPKNVLTTVGTKSSEMIVAYKKLAADKIKKVNVVHFKETKDQCTQIERCQQVGQESDESETQRGQHEI